MGTHLQIRIFNDSAYPSGGECLWSEPQSAAQFYKEVLLTYRLIFGQDKSSSKDFNALARRWDQRQDALSDPMVEVLCGRRWDANGALQIFEEIEVEEPSSHYSPSHDFPFLGQRLLDIQTYVERRRPESIASLWYDRRNVTQWLIFWVRDSKLLLSERDLELKQSPGRNNNWWRLATTGTATWHLTGTQSWFITEGDTTNACLTDRSWNMANKSRQVAINGGFSVGLGTNF